MLDFRSIETFLWVVKLGSFRGAAARLNTTQPAISQRIAQLEREMGVKLLQRDRRAALPTPSGRQMMVYAEKLIALRSEMLATIGEWTNGHGPVSTDSGPGPTKSDTSPLSVESWLMAIVRSATVP